jgi:hypothetical protein
MQNEDNRSGFRSAFCVHRSAFSKKNRTAHIPRAVRLSLANPFASSVIRAA